MNLLLLYTLLFGTPAHAQAQVLDIPIVFSTTTAPLVIEAYAAKYGIPAQPLIDTLECESQFDPEAIGDKGLARGVAQIRSDYFPEITDKQAFDPFFSIDFMAKQFSLNHSLWWSCYNDIYKKGVK